MAEQPVFWLGGAPGKKKSDERQSPEAERYEPAVRDACEACGFEVDEYIAAQGGFGGWLAHLYRDGEQFRVFWNGKEKKLLLERARPHGWDEIAAADQDDEGLPGFVEAVKRMLGAAV